MIQNQVVKAALQEAMAIDGAIGAAMVDFVSGMCLGTAGGGAELNLEVAAAGNTDVVRAKRKVMEQLGITGGIEDILITLNEQYHLIRILKSNETLFMYIALHKKGSNLAMARRQLQDIEARVK